MKFKIIEIIGRNNDIQIALGKITRLYFDREINKQLARLKREIKRIQEEHNDFLKNLQENMRRRYNVPEKELEKGKGTEKEEHDRKQRTMKMSVELDQEYLKYVTDQVELDWETMYIPEDMLKEAMEREKKADRGILITGCDEASLDGLVEFGEEPKEKEKKKEPEEKPKKEEENSECDETQKD